MKAYLSELAWPFRPLNVHAVMLGAVLAVVVPGSLGLFPGIFVWMGWPLFLGLAGYYAVFLRDIMENAMAGRERAPAWPVHGLDELITELFSVLGPILTAFFPVGLAMALAGGFEVDWLEPVPSLTQTIGGPLAPAFSVKPPGITAVVTALWIAAWLVLPILLVAWPFGGAGTIFHPVALTRAALRVGWEYLLVVALTAGLFLGAWAVTLLPVPAKWGILKSYRAYGVTFLSLIVAARIVGTFYCRHRQALGWERERSPRSLREDPLPEPARENGDGTSVS